MADVRISGLPAAVFADLTTTDLVEMSDLDAIPALQSKKVTLALVRQFVLTAATMLTSLTLGAGGAAYSVSGTNTAVAVDAVAGAITHTANISRGAGAPGTIIFKVGQVAASSNALQVAATVLTIGDQVVTVSGALAATLSTAAQGNVTSLGTLTTLRTSGTVGIGEAPGANIALSVAQNVVAAGAVAHGIRITSTLAAAANGDTLSGLLSNPSFTPGAFTGLLARGLRVSPFSTATFTTPGDPAGVSVGIITGTGATNGYAILVSPPTGATNNYLFSHTTPATFSISATGSIVTSAGKIGLGTTPGTTGAYNVDVGSYGGNSVAVQLSGVARLQSYTDVNISALIEAANKPLELWANNLAKWRVVNEAAGTSTFTSSSVVARLVSGSTSFALRNSGNTASPWLYTEGGTVLALTQATANQSVFTSSGYSLTGSDATGLVSYTGTLNTSGAPVLFKMSITNTASGGSTDFLQLNAGAAGATEIFAVSKGGNVRANSYRDTGGAFTFATSGTTRGTWGPTGTLTLSAPSADTAQFVTSGGSLTGSTQPTLWDFAGTWNTTGTPTAFKVAITNTASNAASLLMNLLAGVGGATSVFSVRVDGAITGASALTVSGSMVSTGGNISATAGNCVVGGAGTYEFNGRAKTNSPADSQFNITNNAVAVGVGFDVSTDAVLKLRTRAQSAYATLDVLGLKASGVAGATGTSTAATGTVTVVNGIVTALT